MRAMLLDRPGSPLRLVELPLPQARHGQVLIAVEAYGVCRTDLHLIDGELPDPVLPMIPGHEIVGRVAALGSGVDGLAIGQRGGVPWLGWTCGKCRLCAQGREHLCDTATAATGHDWRARLATQYPAVIGSRARPIMPRFSAAENPAPTHRAKSLCLRLSRRRYPLRTALATR